jgi:hypothetical protein
MPEETVTAPEAPTETAAPSTDTASTGGGLLDDLVPPETTDTPAEPAPGVTDDAPAEPEPDDEPATPITEAPTPAPAPEKKPETVAKGPELDDEGKGIATRMQKYRTDREALKAKIAAGEFDPLGDDAKEQARLLMEREDLNDAIAAYQAKQDDVQQQAVARTKANKDFWDGFTKQYPAVGAEKGQKLWDDTVAAVRKDRPHYTPDQIVAAATERWESTVKRVAAASPTATKTPTVPLTKPAVTNKPPTAGTRITPATGVAKAPTKSESAAEKVYRELGPVTGWKV